MAAVRRESGGKTGVETGDWPGNPGTVPAPEVAR